MQSRLEAKSYLSKIQPVIPPYRVSQRQGIAWLIAAAQHREKNSHQAKMIHLYERLAQNESIGFRHSVLQDYTHLNWNEMVLFKDDHTFEGSPTPWFTPPLEKRMSFFAKYAFEMAQFAFASIRKAPRYLIEVSCTGYHAPNTCQKLAIDKGWFDQTQIIRLGHMGCYASLPAVHLASQMISHDSKSWHEKVQPHDTISVLSSEFCTLHLKPKTRAADQQISNILFADGAVRMDINHQYQGSGFALLAYSEMLIPDTSADMAWIICDSSFSMSLSRKVGKKIEGVIGNYLDHFLKKNQLKRTAVDRFAIHPGGPKIIEGIQIALDLPEDTVKHSKQILYQFGNMSSCTLPYIWDALERDPDVLPGEMVLSMAFGPGLTISLNLMRKGF